MKQQIAGFLGELAEELGWSPELEQARVREETTQPEKKTKPAVLTPDPQRIEDLRSLATPVDRLRAELDHLHATVKHLGSEVIQLRAQMAQIRSLPTPPDAPEIDELTPAPVPGVLPATATRTVVEPQIETEAKPEPVADVAQRETAAPEARPWPPQLVPKPDVEPAGTRVTDRPTVNTDPVEAVAAASVAVESVSVSEATQSGSSRLNTSEPSSTPAVSEPTTGPASQPAEAASTATPTVVEIDTHDSALEMFPSEPSASRGDSADAQAETEPERHGRGAAGYVKSIYRRMGGNES